MRELKDRIDNLKTEILNGVRIRSRIDEQLQGEKVSAYLIKQQMNVKCTKLFSSITAEAGVIDNVGEGTVITGKDAVEMYIKKYYENLYKKEHLDENSQDWFLSFVTRQIDQADSALLGKNVTMTEVYEAIKDMKTNKSPGIDGLPIEFYVKFWEIIKEDLFEILVNIIGGTELQEFQRQAIIVLIHKDGDLNQLRNWRPISLICADIKIVAKILAKRLRLVMYKVISKYQYCVQGRTIVDCTCQIRDVLYHVNEADLTGAVVNLDWEKAFDRVDWGLIEKTMYKMGFPSNVINWIMILYKNIQSTCLINGYLTKPFKVERGIRQGCPLSMIVYVIFQEPLYNAIEKISSIIPPAIKSEQIKVLGYADDTTGFMGNDRSLMHFMNLIKIFEKASNSKLNIKKTKIYGFGQWKNRKNWPIPDIKVEMECFKTLGIMFSYNYNLAVDLHGMFYVRNSVKELI